MQERRSNFWEAEDEKKEERLSTDEERRGIHSIIMPLEMDSKSIPCFCLDREIEEMITVVMFQGEIIREGQRQTEKFKNKKEE